MTLLFFCDYMSLGHTSVNLFNEFCSLTISLSPCKISRYLLKAKSVFSPITVEFEGAGHILIS